MENRQIHCCSKTKKVLVVEKITNILINRVPKSERWARMKQTYYIYR